MWQANVVIKNNTDYNLTIDGVGPGNITLEPGQNTSWSSTEVNNSKSLLFWITPNVYYMQGPQLLDFLGPLHYDLGR